MTDERAPLGVLALVTHARDVPSEEREGFANAAAGLAGDPRAILVRTCHRVELYAVPGASPTGGAVSGEPTPPLRLPDLPAGGRRLEGAVAARHLFTVAAGLDSVVVGEDQILHQLRDCVSERHLAGFDACLGPVDQSFGRIEDSAALDPVLERLFQIALRVGRETRSWREGPPRSLADVALDGLERRIGPFLGRTVLVVGAGRMGRLAALGASRRRARVLVANRSWDRAAALAYDVGGAPVPHGPAEPLPACDGIVIAIAGQWPLGPDQAAALLAAGLPVVDLSSPPALDAGLRVALNGRYDSVDDLAHSPTDRLRERLRRRLERRLEAADAEFAQWIRARAAVPAIQALTEQAESHRAAELDRFLRRADHLDPRERELVEQLSHRLVAGLLHAPLSTLRDDPSGDLERAARALFSL